MEIELIYKIFKNCTGVSTDTRKIGKDSMFFALKGPNFNANHFAETAINSGAKYAVIDDPKFKKDDRYIISPDVLKTLQLLGNFHRRTLNIPFIAITGSNGKTTTKELIHAVLKSSFRTSATVGNLNNHIGIPLTLLAIKDDTEIAIIEMGANHQGEIRSYCEIVEPTHGLITNIGKAHLEGFGGVEGVIKGKGELFEYLFNNNGVAFINSSDKVIRELQNFEKPIYYFNDQDFYHCKLLSDNPFVKFIAENKKEYHSRLIGKYNFYNIAAALCIGKYFSVPAELANQAISDYNPENNRSQIINKNSNSIILDAYNANPSSMEAAVQNFLQLHHENKLLVLGDMFELGSESKIEHSKLGNYLSGRNENIILCGKEMKSAADCCKKALYFPERKALETWLQSTKIENCLILIKGSRGMGLEKILNFI